MTKVLIASFDMEIGGVERSLISMLHHFDYKNNDIDLMLYRHSGDLLPSLPTKVNILEEIKAYRTFRMSIGQVLKSGQVFIAFARLLARWKASLGHASENGFKQMQYMWKYALPFLPRVEKKYEIAISYLWPHYFVAEKVNAKKKIAWIHTDFSSVETDTQLDLDMWSQFNYLVAVSDECKRAFIKRYPSLQDKVIVMENIVSPNFIRKQADEVINNPLVDDKRFKIITVARLSYAKGIDRAVEAMNLLKQQGMTNIVWYIVGYGGDEGQIKELITKYQLDDSFVLLGKQLNPYPFIKEADIYVQPSRYEGKAVTVREAQILQKPVIITNYPTAQSQLNDGYDGMICEQSVEGIVERIESLYLQSKLRKKLSMNCGRTDYTNHGQLNKLYEIM